MNAPSAPETNIAVIDVGTNSAKLLVAGVGDDGVPVEKKFMQETPRPGEGVSATGQIGAAGLLRTINAVERLRHVADQYDCERVFAYATHAFRVASNGRKAAARIADETSVAVRILTGEEEARFAYVSARARVGPQKPHLYVVDVGGGSVDFVHGCGSEVLSSRTLPLGALHLTERFVTTDPIEAREFNALRRHLDRSVSLLFDEPGLAGPRAGLPPSKTDLVASGGSVTTIKKMLDQSWEYSSVTTPKIRIGEIRRLEARCLALPLEKRRRMPGIEPERADIIPAGLAVVIAFMDATGKRVLKINPAGVRGGVLAHLIQNNLEW